jgi:hypothetical protein
MLSQYIYDFIHKCLNQRKINELEDKIVELENIIFNIKHCIE